MPAPQSMLQGLPSLCVKHRMRDMIEQRCLETKETDRGIIIAGGGTPAVGQSISQGDAGGRDNGPAGCSSPQPWGGQRQRAPSARDICWLHVYFTQSRIWVHVCCTGLCYSAQ